MNLIIRPLNLLISCLILVLLAGFGGLLGRGMWEAFQFGWGLFGL